MVFSPSAKGRLKPVQTAFLLFPFLKISFQPRHQNIKHPLHPRGLLVAFGAVNIELPIAVYFGFGQHGDQAAVFELAVQAGDGELAHHAPV